MRNEDLSRRLAGELMSIGAVTLSPRRPFRWASGLLSPVYCDNRLTLGHPAIRQMICEGFRELIELNDLPCDLVAGTATAGIPHAAWLADRLDVPMVYVRSTVKAHGKGQQVEGVIGEGQNVVVVEDLVSTGMSSTAVISPLTEMGAQVSAVVAIFTYGLSRAAEAFAASGVPLFTLTDYPTLLEVASESGAVDEADRISLSEWYRDPVSWSKEAGE